jgi:type I restriction enzyme S subunit
MAHYKMSDVAVEVNDRENNPANSQYERFVGLEHYVSGEVIIRNYGSTQNLESAMKIFQSGDVLVARRNVYLKRAATVDFDGLTSGDSIVLRAKNPVIGRILPFVLNTDAFWDFADQYADGTMSKRLSPKTLMTYEFDLPNEDELESFADLLWAANDARESYQELLRQTDELVKSQFIEMFGRFGYDDKGWGLSKLGLCCELNPKRPKGISDDTMVSFVPMSAVSEKGHMDCSDVKPYGDVKKGFTYFAENDVLFAKITPCMENGKGAVAVGLSNQIGAGSTEFHVLRPIRGKSDPYWLYIITMFAEFRTGARKVMTGSGGQLRVPISYLENYPITLPPYSLQQQFAEIVKQSDKSKYCKQNHVFSMVRGGELCA